MPPRPGYKQPSRKGKVSILIHLDEELRTAFKVSAIERGETMQDAIVGFIEEYSTEALNRLRKKV